MTPRRGMRAIQRRTYPIARWRWGKEEPGKDEEAQGDAEAEEQGSAEEDGPWWH